jgi:NitT/TauT family transport system ATP-binding protein
MTDVTVGFIPLLDCACIVAAAECGFAAEEGLELVLVRETSWANVRDRLIVGHLDVAHLLGPMTVASSLGIGHLTVPMIAPFSLGFGGNGITVSTSLWEQMRRERATPGAEPRVLGEALRRVVAVRERAHRSPLTFGIVYPFSCHNYELRYWLAASAIDPDRDVRLVVIPPPLLADAMRAGQIDGFCVGEPWNSVAVDAGVGVIALPTTAIWRQSPEKVLGCCASWAQRHPERLQALLRALFRAARWCENPVHHPALAELLARPRFVGAPVELLLGALTNRLRLMPGSPPVLLEDFFATARCNANFPWSSHALWFYTQMVRWGQTTHTPANLSTARATYRPELYRNALAELDASLPAVDSRIDVLFDERAFDVACLDSWLVTR